MNIKILEPFTFKTYLMTKLVAPLITHFMTGYVGEFI